MTEKRFNLEGTGEEKAAQRQKIFEEQMSLFDEYQERFNRDEEFSEEERSELNEGLDIIKTTIARTLAEATTILKIDPKISIDIFRLEDDDFEDMEKNPIEDGNSYVQMSEDEEGYTLGINVRFLTNILMGLTNPLTRQYNIIKLSETIAHEVYHIYCFEENMFTEEEVEYSKRREELAARLFSYYYIKHRGSPGWISKLSSLLVQIKNIYDIKKIRRNRME